MLLGNLAGMLHVAAVLLKHWKGMKELYDKTSQLIIAPQCVVGSLQHLLPYSYTHTLLL